jgi:hypothetical protein
MSTFMQHTVASGNGGMRRYGALLIVGAVVLAIPRLSHADDATTRPQAPPVSPERLAAEARLREGMRRPINIDVKDVPLERALATVSRRAGVPISVDWESAFFDQPGRDFPISLQLQNVPADRVLALVLCCATELRGGPEAKVYVDADGAHVVRELPEPDGGHAVKPVEVAYDVSDLVRAVRLGYRSNEQCFDDLQRLIDETIAPDTWLENGGVLGGIRIAPAHPPPRTNADDPDNPPRGGGDPRDPMVISTSPEIQAQIAQLLSSLRDGMAGLPPARPAAVGRSVAALARPVPATFKLLPLKTVLDSIRRSARINLFVDWLILKENGITPETLITTPVPPNGMLAAGDALSAVLEAVRHEHEGVTFDIDTDGVVRVFMESQPDRQVVTCCYNIRALLQTRMACKLWPADASIDARGDAIEKELEQEVAPDSWRETGGDTGSIRIIGPVLVVTQTPLNLERVAAVLQRLP